MSKKLAIKGDKERGNEVIALLEMLGGVNIDNFRGIDIVDVYVIDKYNNISLIYIDAASAAGNHVIFTLNEFYKKYPFKVGDKVTLDNKLCTVIWMCWECNNIYYMVQGTDVMFTKKVTADELKSYKEQDNMETTVESNKRDREDVLFDSIIWHLRNSVNNGKQNLSGGDCEAYFRELVKKVKMYKPAYPKTIEECYEVLEVPSEERYVEVDNPVFLNKLIVSFTELLIARKAYWKIAGEQMGLGKPWEPKHDYDEEIFFIYCDRVNGINKGQGFPTENYVLTFLTKEMRDAFHENFKELIEQCKELL